MIIEKSTNLKTIHSFWYNIFYHLETKKGKQAKIKSFQIIRKKQQVLT